MLRNHVKVLSIIALSSGCTPPEYDVSVAEFGGEAGRVDARPCRSDLFFFEKPTWSATPFPTSYATDLQMAVQPMVNPAWFEEVDLAAPIEVRVTSVLRERMNAPWFRSD